MLKLKNTTTKPEKLSEGFIDKINKMNDYFQATVRQTGFEKSKAVGAGVAGGALAGAAGASLLTGVAPAAVALFMATLLANSAFRLFFLKKVARCLGEKVGEEAIEALRVQKTFDSGTSSEMIEARKARKTLEEIRAKLVKKGC